MKLGKLRKQRKLRFIYGGIFYALVALSTSAGDAPASYDAARVRSLSSQIEAARRQPEPPPPYRQPYPAGFTAEQIQAADHIAYMLHAGAGQDSEQMNALASVLWYRTRIIQGEPTPARLFRELHRVDPYGTGDQLPTAGQPLPDGFIHQHRPEPYAIAFALVSGQFKPTIRATHVYNVDEYAAAYGPDFKPYWLADTWGQFEIGPLRFGTCPAILPREPGARVRLAPTYTGSGRAVY